MTNTGFIQLASAKGTKNAENNTESLTGKNVAAEGETVVSEGTEHKSEGGIEIQPTTIAFQALNFLLLVVVLYLILYKPIIKMLAEREKRIREGVENAEKADSMIKESSMIRQDMIKRANSESQDIMEKARKSGEETRSGIVQEAHTEAEHIIIAGQNLIEMEKSKAAQEVKKAAVSMILSATEKILRSKIDAEKDAALIQESLQTVSAK
jgi:F-type H+-transporting ATPase subunit b